MSTTAYKLVDRDGYTRRGQSGETLWLPVGTIVRPTGTGTVPCGPGVLHGYCDPTVAVLGNPIHANIASPRCLQVEIDGEGAWSTDGLKRWTTARLRVVGEAALPAPTVEERVAWAICLAPHPAMRGWAVDWLRGMDRTAAAAAAAEAAAAEAEAAWAAAAARAGAAAWAAERTAARAAEAAARAAEAEAEAEAEAAARAAAAAAAWAAERAAERADGVAAFESRLMPMLARAQAILAGEFPAERFDESLNKADDAPVPGVKEKD